MKERLAPTILGHIASVPPEHQHKFPSPWLPSTGPCTLPKFWPDPQVSGPPMSGLISIVDSVIITTQTDGYCISSPRGLYLRKVYVQGCRDIVLLQRQVIGGPRQTIENPSEAQDWTFVTEAAFTIKPPLTQRKLNDTIHMLQYNSTIWQDGSEASKNLTTLQSSSKPPPPGFTEKHLWNSSTFPNFQSVGVVNVKQSPYKCYSEMASMMTRQPYRRPLTKMK